MFLIPLIIAVEITPKIVLLCRKRTISGSSGDPFSAASPTEYCPNQALKMVQEQMTQGINTSYIINKNRSNFYW